MAHSALESWVGRPCPKCAYVRTAFDANPDWQCPRCQIAYRKFLAAPPIRQRIAAHGHAMAKRAGSDHSLAVLVAANLVALAVAYLTRMTLRDLMLVYWIQSVVIGSMYVVRILRLQAFSVANVTMNGRALDETPASKQRIAAFFALHYGIFHMVYFVFIAFEGHGQLAGWGAYALCALSFLITHAFSLQHNLENDAAGRPNIGTLFMLPYARIIPMHVTILTGLAFTGSAGATGLLVFGALKILADCMMHIAEHHLMAQVAGGATELDSRG